MEGSAPPRCQELDEGLGVLAEAAVKASKGNAGPVIDQVGAGE